MEHRDTITEIIHNTAAVMQDTVEIEMDGQGWKIDTGKDFVQVKLIIKFIVDDSWLDYSYINLKFMVWNDCKIIHISKVNDEVRKILNDFIGLVQGSYKVDLDNEKDDKQAKREVKRILKEADKAIKNNKLRLAA